MSLYCQMEEDSVRSDYNSIDTEDVDHKGIKFDQLINIYQREDVALPAAVKVPIDSTNH